MDEFSRFLAVTELKSISGAAKLLNVSQPALSRTIAMLEERLKAPLFSRSSRGVELTPVGAVLYEHASAAMRALRDAEEEIKALQRDEDLTLTICAGDSWGYAVLPPIIGAFARRHPKVRLTLDIAEHENRVNGLRNGRYEVAFGITTPKFETSPIYTWIPMMTARFDIYTCADHPLQVTKSMREEDLLSYPWINHNFEFDVNPSQWRQTNRNYAIRCNTLFSAIQVAQGSSFLISTARAFAGMLGRFGTVRLMEDPISPLFTSGLLYPNRTPLRPAAKAFVQMVIAACRPADFQSAIGRDPGPDPAAAGVCML